VAEENPPSTQENEHERNDQAEYITAVEQEVGTPLRRLSNQLASLIDEIKTNNETTNREQTKNRRKQLYWFRFNAISATILTFLTLVVLYKTLGVIDKQREITEGQLAIMKGQLKEMRDGSALTMMQVESIFGQSQAAKSQVEKLEAGVKAERFHFRDPPDFNEGDHPSQRSEATKRF